MEALSYPVDREEWWLRVAVGGVVTFIGNILLFPYIFVVGYLVRVLRETIVGNDEPPSFDGIVDLLLDGIKGTLIVLVYQIVPLGILMVSWVFVSIGGGGRYQRPDEVLVIVGFVGIILGIGLYFLTWYFIPAALANSARTDRVLAAFSTSDLFRVTISTTYLFGWLLAVVVYSVFLALSVFLVFIPLINIVYLLFIAPFVTFYLFVMFFRIFGAAYAKEIGIDPNETTQTAATQNPV